MWTLYLHSLVICLACYQVDGSLPTNVLTPSCSPEAKVCHLPNVNIETRLSMAMYDEKTKQAKRVFAKSGGLFYKKSCSSPKLHHIYYHDVDSINALDGTFRYITTLNGGYPGPAFVVYENQEIVVNFTNNYIQEGTSIHFHGLGQRCTNWMDGVPGLNQCAFNQGVTFTYRFKVTPKGTHWYHSHYGFQRMDGLYGAFIVLPQNGSFPEPPYYQELLMVVQDFFPLDGDRMFTSLDQGLGGYLFEGCNQEGGRTADGAFTGPYQFYSALVNGRGRRYYDNGTAIEKVPMEVYRVRPNEKYKFRLLNAGTQFAFNISIDNHPITVVNTEIAPIEPVTADSIMVFVAERYEFYITTYKTVGNYWIRIETIEEGVKHFTLAVLRYEGAALKDPTSSPKNCTLKDKCRIFNCPYISRNDNKVCINVGEWTEQRGDFRNSTVDVNETLFFHDQKDIYNNDQASINGILFDPPTVPPSVLVRSSYDFNCTQNSTKRCTHQKVIKVNDTVQYVFIASQFNHPIHTHGYWYHILKVGYALPVTYDNLNLKRPVFKDTIALPSKGYAIIRFYANNTGWWFMHCHISVHLAQGMAMIQQVGEPNQMVAPPKTMHLCGNVKEKTSKSSKKLIAKLRKGKLKSFRIARKIDKCPANVQGDVYKDFTNPYKPGEFTTSTRRFSPVIPSLDKPPMHNKVYFPEAEGNYAVFYYLTGFGGVLPASFYDDVLHMIASHGYIVVGTWPLVAEGFPRFNAEAHFENIDWLKENIHDKLGGAKPSWRHVTLSGHSAGCGPILNMVRQDRGVAQAIVNLEPVSDAIQDGINFTMPVLNLGAELANMSCSYPGVDFETHHKMWTCPKIMVEVENVGHCDFLDDFPWTSCKVLRFCEVGPKENLYDYRMLIQGITSAFMTAYVQGNMAQLRYVTDQSLIPMEMKQHDVQLAC